MREWVDPIAMLERYADTIRKLPPNTEVTLDLMAREFTLLESGDVRICFAPCGRMNPSAKIVIVGITPGLSQTQIAMQAARRCLLGGGSYADALETAERECSFAGAMRTNLCRMLDDLGLAHHLGLSTTTSLFAADSALCASTSAIRYPVFVKGRNFTGHSPDLLKTEVFRRALTTMLAADLRPFAHALVVPCGDAVTRALAYLQDQGLLGNHIVLAGLPHASGANGHRKRQFAERRQAMLAAVARWIEGAGPRDA